MDAQVRETRNKQVMVRLSDLEYAALVGASVSQQRKVADMARVLLLRAMDNPYVPKVAGQ